MTMDRLRAVIFLSHMSRNRGSVWAEQRGGLQTNEAPSWAKIRRCTPATTPFSLPHIWMAPFVGLVQCGKAPQGGELVSNCSSLPLTPWGAAQTPSLVWELVWFASRHLVLSLFLFHCLPLFDLEHKTPAVSIVSHGGLQTCVLFQYFTFLLFPCGVYMFKCSFTLEHVKPGFFPLLFPFSFLH